MATKRRVVQRADEARDDPADELCAEQGDERPDKLADEPTDGPIACADGEPTGEPMGGQACCAGGPSAQPCDRCSRPRGHDKKGADPHAAVKEAFLRALRRTFAVGEAAEAAGIARSTAYKWREMDEEFRRQWDDIIESHLDRLEQALIERGMRREKPDTIAAIFILKGHRKEKYAERTEVGGPGGQPINIVLGGAPSAPGIYGPMPSAPSPVVQQAHADTQKRASGRRR